jgi:hypothetical protein
LKEKSESRKKREGAVLDFDEIAKTTLTALGMWRLPVNPLDIAKEEGIELAAGRYGPRFDARIEFVAAIKTFILYYRAAQHGRTEGRVRFSIAHELGHFYLPGHRDYLLSGHSHNSVADFRSRDPREQEADEFAAALLMPHALFVAELKRRGRKYCTLSDLCALADNAFYTSITSTVRRYLQFDWEACAMIVSEAGKVKWARHSDSMRARNMSYLAEGVPVPNTTPTAKVWAGLETTDDVKKREGRIDPEVWYSRPYRGSLWEEAMPLGRTGQVLTFLTLADSEDEDGDDD